MWFWTPSSVDHGSDGTFSGPRAFLFVWTITGPGQRGNYSHSHQTPRAARPLGQSGPWAQMASTVFLSPTYLGSFLQKSDNHGSVPAPHSPIQRAHSTIVNVLDHGPVIHQELDLGHGPRRTVNTSTAAQHCLTEVWLLPELYSTAGLNQAGSYGIYSPDMYSWSSVVFWIVLSSSTYGSKNLLSGIIYMLFYP